MKGVGRLIEVYGLKGDKLSEPNPSEYEDNKIDKHTDDEVPSIAIIPFENKGKEEDVFYAYGISADLISDCSGAGLIRVAGLKDIEKLDYANLKYEELRKSTRFGSKLQSRSPIDRIRGIYKHLKNLLLINKLQLYGGENSSGNLKKKIKNRKNFIKKEGDLVKGIIRKAADRHEFQKSSKKFRTLSTGP